MKDYEILEQAWDLINKPNSWTKNYYARDEFGNLASICSTKATCFCSVGAILKILNLHECEIFDTNITQLKRYFPKFKRGHHIARINDNASSVTDPKLVYIWEYAINNAKTQGL